MTLTLHGFPVSNYYNKVKLILLEKGLPWEHREVHPMQFPEADRDASPLGKVPYLRTEHGSLCESAVIAEYLDALAPEPRLLPADPWAAAKVRELNTFIELHIELVARELYGQAFFGREASAETIERVRRALTKNLVGFQRLAKFAPYVGGDTFTLADCAAWVSLPLVAMATKAVLGEDVIAAAGIDWKGYVKLIDQRPAAQRVVADRKAALDAEASSAS